MSLKWNPLTESTNQLTNMYVKSVYCITYRMLKRVFEIASLTTILTYIFKNSFMQFLSGNYHHARQMIYLGSSSVYMCVVFIKVLFEISPEMQVKWHLIR
jgi:hypothetical protein